MWFGRETIRKYGIVLANSSPLISGQEEFACYHILSINSPLIPIKLSLGFHFASWALLFPPSQSVFQGFFSNTNPREQYRKVIYALSSWTTCNLSLWDSIKVSHFTRCTDTESEMLISEPCVVFLTAVLEDQLKLLKGCNYSLVIESSGQRWKGKNDLIL